ncbi:MAG: hypothetical protein C0491_00170 [Novosphingobium sp.]|nr:hypothetical protein [Novosphingobium sp.]
MATFMARHKTLIAPRTAAPRTAVIAALGAAMLLGGCADRDKFPSLARRPAEDAYRTAQATPPAPPAPAIMSEGMAKRLADLTAQARNAHSAFEGGRASATRAVSAARGAAKGTENWSVASLAVAQLETARARAGLPLAELDRLETEASNRAVDGSDADLKAVREARGEVEALVANETAVIDSLLSQLAG